MLIYNFVAALALIANFAASQDIISTITSLGQTLGLGSSPLDLTNFGLGNIGGLHKGQQGRGRVKKLKSDELDEEDWGDIDTGGPIDETPDPPVPSAVGVPNGSPRIAATKPPQARTVGGATKLAVEWRGPEKGENGMTISGHLEDLLDGLSGQKWPGDSCLTKPRFRNPQMTTATFNSIKPGTVKKFLSQCDRNVLKFSVDTNRGGGIDASLQSGCVYREPDRGYNHWVLDPNVYLKSPLSTRQQLVAKQRRRVRKYRCGLQSITPNLLDVAVEKEWCRKVYGLVTTPYCDVCRLKVLLEDRAGFKACAMRALTSDGNPTLVTLRSNACLQKLQSKKKRC
jgi:hypothetical protein